MKGWSGAICMLFSLSLFFASGSSAAEKGYTELLSPTIRNGAREALVIASPDFPDYSSKGWYAIPGQFRVADRAPIAGLFGIAYRNGSSFMFEVIMSLDNHYLHALVYYDDGKTPALFVKQGVGAIFREMPVDPRWTPEKFFLGFTEKRFF